MIDYYSIYLVPLSNNFYKGWLWIQINLLLINSFYLDGTFKI